MDGMKIEGEIKSEWPDEMITIPKEKYDKLLGPKLVYPVRQKLVQKIFDNTGVENILIIGHEEDIKGRPIYRIRHFGWPDGSEIEMAHQSYLTTEFGLCDYEPVKKFVKLVEIEN